MDTTTTFEWGGASLPVWEFQHWLHLENFLDELCPDAYVATITYELHDMNITGVVFSRDPLVASNAVACYRITDPEPQ